MSEQANRELAYDPQDLEPLLVSRQNLADADGMAALYEPEALLDDGAGRLLHGREAIREFFRELVAMGRKFQMGEQRAALVSRRFGAHLNAPSGRHGDRRDCPATK